jgi:hypothetical protein
MSILQKRKLSQQVVTHLASDESKIRIGLSDYKALDLGCWFILSLFATNIAGNSTRWFLF